MSIAATMLETTGNDANQTSYATGSINPSANRLILAWVYSIAASAPNVPTASGNGLTWQLVDSQLDNGSLRRISLFRAMGSPTSGAVTFDFAAQTQTGCAWSIVEYSGVNTGGTNGSAAVQQSAKNLTPGNATSLTITLLPFADSDNAVAGGFGIPLNTASQPTVGSGFTSTGQRNQANPNLAIGTEFLNGVDTSVDMSSGVGSVPWVGIAVEIAIEPPAPVDPTERDVTKSYLYKWYTGNVFNGLLKPTSGFELPREINSAGSQVSLTLPIALDASDPTLDTDRLVTEDGDPLTDEGGSDLLIRSTYMLGALPNLNDRVDIYEFNNNYPDGLLRFSGLVSKWRTSYKSSSTQVSLLSYGVQLDNYMVQLLPDSSLIEVGNDNAYLFLQTSTNPASNHKTKYVQTFVAPSSTDVTKVYLQLGNNFDAIVVPVKLAIYSGNATTDGTMISSVTRNIPVQADDVETLFEFATPVSLVSGQTYSLELSHQDTAPGDDRTIAVSVTGSSAYAGGTLYQYDQLTGVYTDMAVDLVFNIITASGSLGNVFNSYDPSAIVRELLDSFIALGGNLNYTAESIADTGTTVSYTFKYVTYLDAIKKCVELAPANWYWYVDPATNTVYFQAKPTSPDHTLIKGKHLEDVEVEYSLEQMRNKFVFTGGDTGSGENLVYIDSNEASTDQYGNWLEFISDNRVTLNSTASTIVNAALSEKAYPRFSAFLAIPATLYDVTLFQPGQVIAFANFNPLIDSLSLKIMSIRENTDIAGLDLEILPPTQSKRIEDIRRNLLNQQTEDNPEQQ